MSTVVDLTVWRQKCSLRRIELGVSIGAQNVGDHRLTQKGGSPPTIKEQVGRGLRLKKLEDGR